MNLLKLIELYIRHLLLQLASAVFSRKKKQSFATNFLPKKILLIRTDKIGDAIISTPLFKTLRELFPDSEITVLLSKKNESSSELLPYISNTLSLGKSLNSAYKPLRNIRLKNYDVCINLLLNRSTTAILATLFSGAKYKIGFQEEDFLYDINIPKPEEIEHISITTQRLLSPFTDKIQSRLYLKNDNLKNDDLKNGISVSNFDSPQDAEEINANDSITKDGGSRPKKIGLNISAGKNDSKWGIENNIQLAKMLKQAGYNVEIISAIKDKHTQELIAQRGMVACSEVFHSLSHFVKMLSKFDIIITPDTSVTHIASAIRKKIVLLISGDKDKITQWSPIDVEYRIVLGQNSVNDIKAISVFNAVLELQ